MPSNLPPPSDCDCDDSSDNYDNSDSSDNSFASIIRTSLTYDTNVMLAAIISLLLVILFVLLLHLYSRWFLGQARRRSRTSVTVPHVLGSRLHHRFTINPSSPGKHGLPLAVICALPLFVYESSSEEGSDHGLECAICLSVFEEEEIGRKLPDCGHAFHMECIDMWLESHFTCPICRAAIQLSRNRKSNQVAIEIADAEQDSEALTVNNEEELRSEIVTTNSDEIVELDEMADVVAETESGLGVPSSSSIGESLKKLLGNSGSCSGRSGGKIHPSSNVNGEESEA